MAENEYLDGLRLLSRPDASTAADLVSYQEARDALGRPAPSPEPPVCLRHDWNPPRAFPGAPRPPRAECPGCRREAEHLERRAPEEGYATEERSHPQYPNRAVDPRLERAWQLKLVADQEAGLAVSGSFEEQRAIEAADARRKQEIARDHPRQRVASQRYEGGRWVVFYHPPKKRKSRGGRGATWHESDSGGEITVEAADGRR